MIKINNNTYYLVEPTVGEYRILLEFKHAILEEASNQPLVNRRLMEVIPRSYGLAFTSEELELAVESNDILYDERFYKHLHKITKNDLSNQDLFYMYGMYLVGQRQSKIGWVYETHIYLAEQDDIKSEIKETNKERTHRVRRQLLGQYKTLVIENMLFRWTELDNLTIRAFIDFMVSLESEKPTKLKNKRDEVLANKLGVKQRGFKNKEVK